MPRYFAVYLLSITMLFLAGCANQNATEVAEAPAPILVVTATPAPVATIAPTIEPTQAPSTVQSPDSSTSASGSGSSNSRETVTSLINRALGDVEAASTPEEARRVALSMYSTEADLRQAQRERTYPGAPLGPINSAEQAAIACAAVGHAATTKAELLEGAPFPELKRTTINDAAFVARFAASKADKAVGR